MCGGGTLLSLMIALVLVSTSMGVEEENFLHIGRRGVELSGEVGLGTDGHPLPYFLLVSDIHYDEFYQGTEEAGTLCREEESYFENMWKRKKAKVMERLAAERAELKSEELRGLVDDAKKATIKKLKKKYRRMSTLPQYGKKKKKARVHHKYEDDHGCKESPCEFGRFGCDSPYSLVQNSAAYMKSLPGKPEFVVVTGDWAAHYLPGIDKTKRAVSKVYDLLRESFPGSKLVPVLGNNDVHPHYNVYCKDWVSQSDVGWFDDLLKFWSKDIPADQESSFSRGAYYTTMVSEKVKMIVLNTVFYSKSAPAPPTDEADDPCGQFEWLKQQLNSVKQQGLKAIITSHIAPGMGRGEKPNSRLWHDRFVSTYVSVLRGYSDVVIGQLYGHTHRDMVVRTKVGDSAPGASEPVPILYTSAISPVRDNNPAFKQVYFRPGEGDGAPALVDYTAHSAAMPRRGNVAPKWSVQYTFSKVYAGRSLERESMIQWVKDVVEKKDLFDVYYKNRMGGYEPESYNDDDFKVYTCGMQYMDWESYSKCADL